MCIKPLTPKDKLNLELITSPPRKKFKTTFGSLINDSEENEERTYSYEIGSGRGEEFDATTMQGSIEEEPKPNLDQVIDNIQVEHIMFAKHVVSIIEPTVVTT